MLLADYVKAVRRHLAVVLLCTTAGLLLAAMSVLGARPQYTASRSVLVTGSSPSRDVNQIAADRVSSYLTIADSEVVAREVSTALLELGRPIGTYTIGAANPTGTSIITLTATAGSADGAEVVVTTAMTVFIRQVASIEREANGGGTPVSTLVPIGTATLPASPDARHRSLVLALGLGAGLFFGVCGALLLYGVRRQVRGVEDVEDNVGVRVLGYVPRPWNLRRGGAGGRAVREAFRRLLVPIQESRREGPAGQGTGRIVLVTSPTFREPAVPVGRGLANALLSVGSPVALIGLEGRQPADAPGGSDTAPPGYRLRMLRPGQGSTRLDVIVNPSEIAPTDPPDHDGHGQPSLPYLLTTLRRQSVSVVLCAPGLLRSADAALLADRDADVVLVLEEHTTALTEARRAVVTLSQSGTNLLGVVLAARRPVTDVLPRFARRRPVPAAAAEPAAPARHGPAGRDLASEQPVPGTGKR